MHTQESLNSQTYYWVTCFFSILGMMFNSLFLFISTENPERRNLTDSTMIAASITMIVKGFGLFINGFLIKSQGSEAIFGQLQNVLGILIEPRRGFLLSFLCTETILREEDERSPNYDLHELYQRDDELAITNGTKAFKNWRSERVSETSCTSANITQLSTRCSSMSTTSGKKKEGNQCDFFLDESEKRFKIYNTENWISRRQSFTTYKCNQSPIETSIYNNNLDTSLSNSVSDLSSVPQDSSDLVESVNQRAAGSLVLML
ncbi:unnamed protein product [Mytilus coruscus]|uniref:Uncharacterized protein n=1 Tax=Mytilus coruscus TaxID=42192 RepID=A0A6J8BKJ4_MYTCO|nr:unnamed protein product [Mytilus coruscus]